MGVSFWFCCSLHCFLLEKLKGSYCPGGQKVGCRPPGGNVRQKKLLGRTSTRGLRCAPSPALYVGYRRRNRHGGRLPTLFTAKVLTATFASGEQHND